MPLELPPPTLIDDAAGLTRLLDQLDRQREIAVDTEADSFFSYREKVCLIQITAGERDYLVDPLAGFDLAPLGAVFADGSKVKVFHDGEYDVLILKRLYRFGFKNLFDTRVAAATLGSQSPGLASVLNERFGVLLDKAMQRSNWGTRPLSDEQIAYARLDTHFLLPLMHAQRHELEAQDRAVIVAGECARLERLEPVDAPFEPNEFVRLKGARALAPIERQVLRELFKLREERASESDQPPFRIVNNEVIVRIAQLRPRTRRDLAGVAGFSHKQIKRFGDEVLAAVRRGEELGPLQRLPSLPSKDGTGELSDDAFELHERLKRWRKDRAAKLGIESGYLLNRHVLLTLAKERPNARAALAAIDGILDWQLERFGDELVDLLRGFERDLAAGKVEPSRRRGR